MKKMLSMFLLILLCGCTSSQDNWTKIDVRGKELYYNAEYLEIPLIGELYTPYLLKEDYQQVVNYYKSIYNITEYEIGRQRLVDQPWIKQAKLYVNDTHIIYVEDFDWITQATLGTDYEIDNFLYRSKVSFYDDKKEIESFFPTQPVIIDEKNYFENNTLTLYNYTYKKIDLGASNLCRIQSKKIIFTLNEQKHQIIYWDKELRKESSINCNSQGEDFYIPVDFYECIWEDVPISCQPECVYSCYTKIDIQILTELNETMIHGIDVQLI